MAARGDMVKKVMLFKLQLSSTAEPATVLKILQKLKKLDITLHILAETGIGKAVNSLRRHKEAGKIAKSLVEGWKKLMIKEPTSIRDDGELSGRVHMKEKLDDQRSTINGSLNGNGIDDCLISDGKNQDSSDDNRKMDTDRAQRQERKRRTDNKIAEKLPKREKPSVHILTKKNEVQAFKMENSTLSKKKKKCGQSYSQSGASKTSNRELEDLQMSRSDSREKSKATSGRPEREYKASKESSQKAKEPFLFSDLPPTTSKGTKDIESSGTWSSFPRSLESPKGKREKAGAGKHNGVRKYRSQSDDTGHSEHKKHKKNPSESENDQREPSMSFESFLNYDENVFKMKKSVRKKPAKNDKRVVKDQKVKVPVMDDIKSPATPPKQKFQSSISHLKEVPLPALLPECDNPSIVEYIERKVEKESDIGDVSEESGVFTGQRLYKKMQVYSGSKTVFLPAMMSLYQQCIRTLQNNIGLLHETGGVPFEILEPVLERCTPEQLLHIEECNPSYIGMTDHLWGKHCHRDFKDSKLQEYESWKEMYVRLFEEREMKLKRLTKTIVSAQSRKPQGRQLKMAFIHTVAKPPRDVRIQQELHGTAVQQAHLSVKAQDNRPRLNCTEPSSSNSSSSSSNNNNSSSSGGNSSQDARKKNRVAPMMAKSLKAFKKQLQRR